MDNCKNYFFKNMHYVKKLLVIINTVGKLLEIPLGFNNSANTPLIVFI